MQKEKGEERIFKLKNFLQKSQDHRVLATTSKQTQTLRHYPFKFSFLPLVRGMTRTIPIRTQQFNKGG